MSLHRDYDEKSNFSDFNIEEDKDELIHKKQTRRLIEDKLERKRLRQELQDEFDDEFNWEDLD